MSEPIPSTSKALIRTIDEAWVELMGFLRQLTQETRSSKDDNGWTVRDHTTHIAVWEASVAVLFRGGQRHEALGVDATFYKQATFDQINAIVRERNAHLQLQQAVALLAKVHLELMGDVQRLSDLELATTVRDFFPRAPREDDRTMAAFIYWNTADHFKEHLPWMRDLAEKASKQLD